VNALIDTLISLKKEREEKKRERGLQRKGEKKERDKLYLFNK
jgi:hypothetical protein